MYCSAFSTSVMKVVKSNVYYLLEVYGAENCFGALLPGAEIV